ncbi:Proofreading thioesterase EntH [Kluyvera cryocrescens]|uniref:Proofreading thioesterase EntH n=1 Tax=Kluyvera cryocrescens TaxID=580 RepID=A0A485CJR4_KLUCR|nr:Proofreading thioesterase EntH [Kluyvera cryocrescens]
MIWKRHLTLDELNATSDNTMVAHLGIVYTHIGDDSLEAVMPVDSRTHQPFGLLHGGASAALAETLGSMAGFLMTPRRPVRGRDRAQCVAPPSGIAGAGARGVSAAASWPPKPELGNCGILMSRADAAVPAD